MARYLKRRKRGWYFQLEVPAHLREHFGGRPRIEQTLSTRDEKLAEAKAKQLAGEYKLRFLALEGVPDAKQALIRAAYDDTVKAVLDSEIVAFGRPEDDPVELGVELAVDKILDKPGRRYDEDGDPILSAEEEAALRALLDGLRLRKGKKPNYRERYEPNFEAVANEWIGSWETNRDRRPSCRFPLRFDPGFSSRSDPGCG